jgi:hypothetical protein
MIWQNYSFKKARYCERAAIQFFSDAAWIASACKMRKPRNDGGMLDCFGLQKAQASQ